MTLATYTDLTTAIGNWLQRQDLAAVTPSFVQLFEACANRRLRVRQQEATVELTPANGVVVLPADYLAWRRLTWTGNPRQELAFVEPSWLQAAYPDLPTDTPRVFTIEGGNILTMPLDPTDTALELVYFQQIPSLAANSTNWLMSQHPDLYLFGSLAEAEAYTVNPDAAALWKSRRDELFDEIERLSNKSRGAGAVRIMGPTP
ncbi:MAG TPA: hypothetical protein VKW08_15090 [Xanthobacteraceae bacterium]|jgi:hypothetical protein|nr:hypothetical protein [Xanthobacteraceae bacterium]